MILVFMVVIAAILSALSLENTSQMNGGAGLDEHCAIPRAFPTTTTGTRKGQIAQRS